MTSEPLALQVARCVLASRLPAASDQADAVQRQVAALSPLPTALPVFIRVSVGHGQCLARCGRSTPVELWTIVLERSEEGKPALAPVFLLNAVRSHAHFSQLSAWLARMDEEERAQLSCSYEIVHDSLLFSPCDGKIVEHLFPLCEDLSRPGCRVRVTVQFVQREEPLRPAGMCLQLGPLPTDEWLLPSPLPSPTGRDDIAVIVNTALWHEGRDASGKQQHKVEPPLTPYSPNGPAEKAGLFAEDGLLIEECTRREETTLEKRYVEGRRVLAQPRTQSPRLHAAPRRKISAEERRAREETPRRKSSQQAALDRRHRQERSRPLLGNWEESALRGRIPGKAIEGYRMQIAATGIDMVCAPVTMRVEAAALEYGSACVARAQIGSATTSIGRRGYRVPTCGKLQLTLFNPEGGAVRMFLVPYDLSAMAASSCSFIRQRLSWDAVRQEAGMQEGTGRLRFLVHISVHTDHSTRLYLRDEIKILFSTDASIDADNLQVGEDGVSREARKFDIRSSIELPGFCPKFRAKRASGPCSVV